MPEKTEILIIKNPFFYKHLSEEAFERLIPDGQWIQLVFGAIERVVNARFFELCELDWDYLREANESISAKYFNYKSLYFKGLDDKQTEFAHIVADEIESEIERSAHEALASLDGEED